MNVSNKMNCANRTLFIHDNLRVLRGMDSETVDLIATDPPFNTKRSFNAPLGSKAAKQRFSDRWRWDDVAGEWSDLLGMRNPAMRELIEAAAVIEGGSVVRDTGEINTGRVKNSMAAFLCWMAPRVTEMHRVLKPTGSIYLHCDPEANTYLRLLMDAVFGRSNFRSEIVWRRSNAHNKSKRQYGPIHDTLLFYAKTMRHRLHQGTRPYTKSYIKDRFTHEDTRGQYQLNYLTGPETREGESGKEWGGYDPTAAGRHWAIPKSLRSFLPDEGIGMTSSEKLDSLHNQCLILFPKKEGGQPMYKQYIGDGVPYQDIWLSVPLFGAKAESGQQ